LTKKKSVAEKFKNLGKKSIENLQNLQIRPEGTPSNRKRIEFNRK